jgi:hypothetical protein
MPAPDGSRARQLGVPLPAELNDPEAALPPGRIVGIPRDIAGHFFPLLAADAKDLRETGPAKTGP